MAVGGSLLHTALLHAALRVRGIRARGVRLDGMLPIIYGDGSVMIGRRLAVRAHTARTEIGALKGGCLRVGERLFVNQGASLVAAHSITIGDDVCIGDFAAIYDSGFHPVDEASPTRVAPVVLGDNVWVARGAIVLPGVTIGAHAVVGAGAVVTGDVEGRTLVVGNPARAVRTLRASDGWARA